MPKPIDRIDPRFLTWASPYQERVVEAVNRLGSLRAAARELKLDSAAVVKSIQALRRNAALKGFSPEHDMTHAAPDPFVVRGVSTYYDKEGKARGQWVKTKLDDERADLARKAALEALAESLPRLAPQGPVPGSHASHLCNVFTLTDSHVGALAWHKEGGEDWDLKIAEATLVGCFKHAVRAAPRAEVGFVNQLGDFLHYDSLTPVTPTHGHILDADGRFSKMVGTAIRVLRRVIDFALARHPRVVVLVAEGNHDMASAVWLRHMFKALYENEPRVTIIDSELPYYAWQHGKTMLAFHHGHLRKNEQLPQLFAAQFPSMWGATMRRYAHTGHRHHVEEKEYSGMIVRQHPTLAARDAHAARGGWIADRSITALTYHSTFGEVARNSVTPDMLEAGAA